MMSQIQILRIDVGLLIARVAHLDEANLMQTILAKGRVGNVIATCATKGRLEVCLLVVRIFYFGGELVRVKVVISFSGVADMRMRFFCIF
jgi:hypothetical protein